MTLCLSRISDSLGCVQPKDREEYTVTGAPRASSRFGVEPKDREREAGPGHWPGVNYWYRRGSLKPGGSKTPWSIRMLGAPGFTAIWVNVDESTGEDERAHAMVSDMVALT